MITRPFEVADYVKIGEVEGEVKEITLNYVKIYTPTYTLTEMPNRTVLNSSITRYMSEDGIDYSFSMSFASMVYPTSWVHISDLYEKILEPAVDEFWGKYGDILQRKPKVSISRVEFLNRTLTVRLFIPAGKSKRLYDLQPELQKMILTRLDGYRKEKE